MQDGAFTMFKPLFLAAMLAGVAGPAAAVPLIIDSGWYNDLVTAVGKPSPDSPYTFTLSGNAIFRISDTLIPGAIFTATDAGNGILAATTFTTDGAAIDAYNGTA